MTRFVTKERSKQKIMSTEVGLVCAASKLDQFSNDSTSNSEEGKWNAELEVLLLQLVCTHVPKGINKNFQMACIVEKLSGVHSKQILAASVWSHLKKYYDLDLIGKNESAAFPMQVTDYTLPDTGFEIPPLAEAEKPVPVPEATIELKPKDTKRRDSSQRGKKEASTPEIQEEKSSKRKRSSASDGEKKNTPTAAAPVKRRRNY